METEPSLKSPIATAPWELRRDLPNNFDAIRLVLSLCVVYVHSITSLRGIDLTPERSDLLCYLTRGSLHLGELAVECFFILSGLLIAHSWNSSAGGWDFLVRRILRIYPAFLATILFCTFVVGPLASPAGWGFLKLIDMDMWLAASVRLSLALPALFTENPQPDNANVSLWTIPYEFDCYLCILALGSTYLLRSRGVILVGWLTTYFFHAAGSAEHWPKFLCYFFCGTVFYLYRAHIPKSRPIVIASCGLLALLTATVPEKLPIVMPLCSTYIIFYIAFSRSFFHNISTKIGDLSYGTYLFAFPVQQLLVQHYREQLTPNTLFVAASIITCVLATCSWYLIERPFLHIRQRAKVADSNLPLRLASTISMLIVAAFGTFALAHTLGGAKIGKVWQMTFHSQSPIVVIALTDALLVLWLLWSVAVLKDDKAHRPTWKNILAQTPFWAWFGLFVFQSITSLARSLPGWLPGH